jgi:hypothetical protein
MPAPDDASLKLGFLMEAAERHQRLAEQSLEGLQGQLREIDGAIREEVQRVLQSELLALSTESHRTGEALRALRESLRLRVVAWTLLATCCSSALALGTLSWALPSRAEVEALRLRRDALAASIGALERRGAHLDIRPCGGGSALCVRIDRKAPPYGADGDYRVARSD